MKTNNLIRIKNSSEASAGNSLPTPSKKIFYLNKRRNTQYILQKNGFFYRHKRNTIFTALRQTSYKKARATYPLSAQELSSYLQTERLNGRIQKGERTTDNI